VARVAGRSFSREEVAQAAWRVIVRDGLHRTTVRAIARELDATTGVVTYYFSSKTELLHFVLDRLTAAIGRAVEAARDAATGVDRLRNMLAAILPLGPREVTGWRIWVAFVGQAITSRRLREEHQRRLDVLSEMLTCELASLQEQGQMAGHFDPRREADALIAFADGIGMGHLLRPRLFPPARQVELMDRMLARELGLALPAGRRRPRPAAEGPRRAGHDPEP
jgi:AcrR family transcriptional regulator